MKKIILSLIMAGLMTGNAFAASSATDTIVLDKDDVKAYRISWTAHTDGTFTSYAMTNAVNGAVWLVVTDPGSTAPTDNYDITLTDSTGVDVMGGTLANRDTTNSEQVAPAIGSQYGPRPVTGKLTLNISNNSVNTATGSVYIYVFPLR